MACSKRKKSDGYSDTIGLGQVFDLFGVPQGQRNRPGRWSLTILGTDVTLQRTGELQDDNDPEQLLNR